MTRRSVGSIVGKVPSLRWRIVTVLLVAALLPLGLAGFGSWIVFGELLERRALEQMRTIVQSHALAIESYLSERVNLLQLLASSTSIQNVNQQERLQELLANLNHSSGGGFIDLGVIDTEGRHLAYAGPYDLQNRNYRETDWFREVTVEGKYISDVFLGFREVPHCIIAVKRTSNHETWILRATINSDQFDALVGAQVLGENSDAYIVNREGFYQTTPKVGAVLDRATVPVATLHRGVQERRVSEDGVVKIEVTTWINDNRWILVVRQDLAAVQAPVNQAIARGANVVLVAVLFLVATTFLATRHLTRRIDTATAQRDEMSRAFMRSAKLASIGELSTGLAHEINNPLATISAELTNISDLVREMDGGDKGDTVLESVRRSKSQIQRCASITKKMLQFGRERESTLEPTEIAPRLIEIKNLLHRRANVRNVDIVLDMQEDLPQVLIDPVELEQVFVNLINNSIDAIGQKGGHIRIGARREATQVHLEVKDDGAGIDPAEFDRIFEPFFTTKPVGTGTGLGLSVCYGIVHSWGGSIRAESERGKGTTMHIYLPLPEQTRPHNKMRGQS